MGQLETTVTRNCAKCGRQFTYHPTVSKFGRVYYRSWCTDCNHETRTERKKAYYPEETEQDPTKRIVSDLGLCVACVRFIQLTTNPLMNYGDFVAMYPKQSERHRFAVEHDIFAKHAKRKRAKK